MTKKPENQSLVEQAFGRLRDDIVFGFFFSSRQTQYRIT